MSWCPAVCSCLDSLKPAQLLVRDIFVIMENLAFKITTNNRVITYILNSRVPRMGKFTKELIQPCNSYSFIMGLNCALFNYCLIMGLNCALFNYCLIMGLSCALFNFASSTNDKKCFCCNFSQLVANFRQCFFFQNGTLQRAGVCCNQ